MISDFKRLIVGIGCKEGKAVFLDVKAQNKKELCGKKQVCSCSLLSLAQHYNDNGADGLLIVDLSETDEDHERTISLIKEIARLIDIPIIAGGRVKRLEDVKKYLYAGAEAMFLNGADDDNIDLIKEASNRFGHEKVYVYLSSHRQLCRIPEFIQLGASMMLLDISDQEMIPDSDCFSHQELLFLLCCDHELPMESIGMAMRHSAGVILAISEEDISYAKMKQELLKQGHPVDTFQSSVAWSCFKTGIDGLIPVIVQDYKTSEVLMMAYMNEQAFEDTLRTGKMNYYSRSRKSQWLKGETSGHFQYVKSLHLDCDNDTLLAKVHQIGAACHTGERSCFFQILAEKSYQKANPLKVFETVFDVILDRKANPKEGSYTNYLFEKGIDKILKKIGEEVTEIVIAAKNPEAEELKYEISDFLYHMMVLMAEKGVTWEDVTKELSNR